VDRYYPSRAQSVSKAGRVVLKCRVNANGTVSSCDVVSEDPADFSFGDAAVKLSKLFKMRPQLADGRPVEGAEVSIPIRFEPAE
jgi:protein TonB